MLVYRMVPSLSSSGQHVFSWIGFDVGFLMGPITLRLVFGSL